jgi:RNA polymerase-interacting CarD/CdnL/TRCF family regulator
MYQVGDRFIYGIHGVCEILELQTQRVSGKAIQYYRELICSGNPTQLLRMIYTLYCRKKQQLDTGRKLHLCDENFLRDAKRLIDSEFSFVLGIEPNEVGTYIRAKFDG